MPRWLRGKAWVLVAALACTPLGLWMYQDPAVEVSRVRLTPEPADSAPVVVALDMSNPNDYPVSTRRVELSLRLDDLPIGGVARDSSVPLPQVATSTVALALVPNRAATPDQLRVLGSGVHRFLVEGRATFATPIGERKVRFAQEGEMAFGEPASPASAPADPDASR
jgi:LEA14-like dessication related protein